MMSPNKILLGTLKLVKVYECMLEVGNRYGRGVLEQCALLTKMLVSWWELLYACKALYVYKLKQKSTTNCCGVM